MKKTTIRSIIAILVVGVFMLITGVMALFPIYAGGGVDLTVYSQYFAQTASVYTGIVGVVIGYYFGRNSKSEVDENEEATTTSERPGS